MDEVAHSPRFHRAIDDEGHSVQVTARLAGEPYAFAA